jgi:hypothetical protein
MKLKDIQENNETQQLKGSAVQPEEGDLLTNYFDGMGTATARILINRHLDESVIKKYGLKDLKNSGRYYTAKIIETDGKLIDEVLIDKESHTIQSLRRKINIDP